MRAKDWSESVRLVLGKEPAFYKSRGTGKIKWGLDSQYAVAERRDGDEDAIPMLNRSKPKYNTASRRDTQKGPSWRVLITEALEKSRTGLLTSHDVCRAIESRHPVDSLGIRSKDWKTCVQCILSKNPTFSRSGSLGKVKWGLTNGRVIAETESDDGEVAPSAPIYTDGKNRWAELASGMGEEDLYSDVDSNASDAHVVENSTGSWILKQDSSMARNS